MRDGHKSMWMTLVIGVNHVVAKVTYFYLCHPFAVEDKLFDVGTPHLTFTRRTNAT
jgi:hypothetical protein